MPSQILDEKERNIQRFVSNNALIEDPVAVEKERKTINPWTPEEKRILLSKVCQTLGLLYCILV